MANWQDDFELASNYTDDSLAAQAKGTAEEAVTAAAEAAATARTASDAADEAKVTAETAHETAGEAKATAETAHETATAADDKAATAKQTAEDATSTAAAASTTASAADKKAAEAATAAATADTKATQAATDAATAKTTANGAASTASTAKTTAEGAVSTAATAKTTAESAASTASTAKTTADAAKTTAITAKTTADTAKSTADTAKTTATTANTTANAAKTAAAAADTKATEAKATADEAKTTADATANFFMADSTGAYVASVEGNHDSGKNLKLSIDGLAIRDGVKDLATFGAENISLGSLDSSVSMVGGRMVIGSQDGLWYPRIIGGIGGNAKTAEIMFVPDSGIEKTMMVHKGSRHIFHTETKSSQLVVSDNDVTAAGMSLVPKQFTIEADGYFCTVTRWGNFVNVALYGSYTQTIGAWNSFYFGESLRAWVRKNIWLDMTRPMHQWVSAYPGVSIKMTIYEEGILFTPSANYYADMGDCAFNFFIV